MNTSRKGSVLERELKRDLEVLGWSVMRGAGSKGEMFGEKVDLIATKLTGRTRRRFFIVGFQGKVTKR